LTITGGQLKSVLERAVATDRQTLFISGATVRYDPSRAVGDRIVAILGPGGRPVAPDRSYSLAVSDFMAGGGDGHSLLATLPRTDLGVVDLDALIALLARLPQPIRAPKGPRFTPVGP
jgi:5'-nucleotidase